MVRNLKSTLLVGLFIILGYGSLFSQQYKVESFRSVIGSGGMVEEASSKGTYVVSGVLSQAIIEDRSSNAYLVKQGFWTEIPRMTSVDENPSITTNGINNYPNPIKDFTNIKFELPGEAYIQVRVYDVTGNLVSTIYDGYENAGTVSIDWYATDNSGMRLSSGNYVCEVSARPAMLAGGDAFKAFVSRKIMTVVK